MSKKPDGQGKTKDKAGKKKKNELKIARSLGNKAKKVARHQRHHPADKTVIGKLPAFPKVLPFNKGHKPSLMHDIDGYLDKKDGKIKVPEVMYRVLVRGVTLEYTHLLSAAEAAFNDCKCLVFLCEEKKGKKSKVLRVKAAVPTMSDKALKIAAFGEQPVKKK